jgi:hypothetical protein
LVLKQEVRVLRGKAMSSFTTATTAFNSPVDDGRVTQILLNLQHAFEMLLKACLVQVGVPVFDKREGRSTGFAACVRRAQSNARIKLTDADAVRTVHPQWLPSPISGLGPWAAALPRARG